MNYLDIYKLSASLLKIAQNAEPQIELKALPQDLVTNQLKPTLINAIGNLRSKEEFYDSFPREFDVRGVISNGSFGLQFIPNLIEPDQSLLKELNKIEQSFNSALSKKKISPQDTSFNIASYS